MDTAPENHAYAPSHDPDTLEAKLASNMERAQENLTRWNERAMTFARERPLTCIAGAVVLGFVVGKIAARY